MLDRPLPAGRSAEPSARNQAGFSGPHLPAAVRAEPGHAARRYGAGRLCRSEEFGSVERAQAMWARVASVAAMDGLEMKFEDIGRQPNTIDAHRLVAWAGTKGRGLALSAHGSIRPSSAKGRTWGIRTSLPVLPPRLACRATKPPLSWPPILGWEDTRQMEEAEGAGGGIDGVPVYIFNREPRSSVRNRSTGCWKPSTRRFPKPISRDSAAAID